jgi:alanyl-tRNA synthetase
LTAEPTAEQIAAIEQQVNCIISAAMPVTTEYTTKNNIPAEVEVDKLPENASDTIRLVRIGDYDLCACIGTHVENTAEIGTFKIISHSWENGTLRLRFKLQTTNN